MPGWNLEWLNMNAARAFPFREDTTRQDVNRLITIPDNLLVDFVMVAPSAADLDFIYVSKLLFSGTTLTLIISESGGAILTSVTTSITAPQNTVYNLVGQGDFSDARGRIVFGELSMLADSLPEGVFEFAGEATKFESRCIRPDLRSVRMLKLVKADGSVVGPITGIVELVEGANVRLTYTAGNPSRITISAIDGEGLTQECECDKTYAPPPPIRTINGVPGDSGGNMVVDGYDCVSVEMGSAQLKLKDKCAKPCCGCTELEFITSNMQILEAGLVALEGRANLLEQNEINFHNTFLSGT